MACNEGYNEPDGHEGGKCTPAQAAADWVHVQALASKFDPPLTLVSPAPVSDSCHRPSQICLSIYSIRMA